MCTTSHFFPHWLVNVEVSVAWSQVVYDKCLQQETLKCPCLNKDAQICDNFHQQRARTFNLHWGQGLSRKAISLQIHEWRRITNEFASFICGVSLSTKSQKIVVKYCPQKAWAKNNFLWCAIIILLTQTLFTMDGGVEFHSKLVSAPHFPIAFCSLRLQRFRRHCSNNEMHK